jgi:alkylhydroperoxidase family enzyme
MNPPPPRIAPLEPPHPPELEAMLQRWMPPDSGREPLALFRVLARHEQLFSRARPLGAGILGSRTLPPRLREVMILRTCALTGAEYEWGVHAVAFARPLGLSESQLAAIAGDGTGDLIVDDLGWDDAERAVLRLADELHTTSTVSDALFAELERHLSHEQVIELCLAAGWYHAISYVINAARVPLEPWAATFPTPHPAPVALRPVDTTGRS